MKRVAIYLRVSTDGQTTENQLNELTARFPESEYTVKIFEDHAISGATNSAKRPALSKLMQEATRHKFDIVAAWSIDRLGRSLRDLVGLLEQIHALDVGLYLHKQAIDTTTPYGKAMFGMLGVFAEFEREMIRERVHAGLSRARAQGKTLGRPAKSRELRAKVKSDQATLSLAEIAAKHNVSKTTAWRIVHEHT